MCWRFDGSRQYDGQVFLLFLVTHETAKFALEFARDPFVPAVALGSLVPAVAGWLALGLARQRRVLA